MAFVPITALPTAPSRTQSQAVFSANTDAFLTALPPLVTEINAGGAAIEASQTAASTSVTASATSATASATSATASAESAANAAASANYKGEWSTLTGGLNIPASVSKSGNLYILKLNLADVTSSEPGVTTDWILLGSEQVIPHTTSGTLTAGGLINQIRDSGAFTMPLAASYDANTILVVELPELYTASAPTLTRSGSDLFRDSSGTDTSITWAGAAKLTLTTNGTDEWSL
mgnify:CR=1 FL=1